MNASASPTSHEENGVCESDSDSNSDDSPNYYQPISTAADNSGGEDSDHDGGGEFSVEDLNSSFHQLPNGWMQNRVSSLDISDDNNDEEDDKGGEESESESEIDRAYREDETRRNAPLPAENAVRVMEAMRGISFGGSAPDWAGQIPEDQWIDRLRGLRRPPSAASGSAPIDN